MLVRTHRPGSELAVLFKWRRCLIPILPVALSGCVRIPVSQHQDLSRLNMVFESQGAFASRPSLFTQTEPGSAISAGGQAAGCAACR